MSGFQRVIRPAASADNSADNLFKKEVSFFWLQKVWKEPATTFYLLQKAMRIPLRTIRPERRGCLIALMGVNGSGKSTLAKKTLEQYQPLTSHLGKKQQYYYYGWEPTFFITKIMSKIFRRSNKALFSEVNFSRKSLKFDLVQEFLFTYLFVEFYYRYLIHLRPGLRRGDLIISDRYFYDIYGQYQYAPRSLILPFLLRIFPRPDFSYVLTTAMSSLLARGKTDQNSAGLRPITRRFFPPEYIYQQSQRYAALSSLLSAPVVNTENRLPDCAQQIVAETWKALLQVSEVILSF